jgi:ATP-binding cassette subfamily B protein
MILPNFKPFFPYIKRYRREIIIGLIALLVTDLTGLAIPWLLKNFIDLLPEDPSQSLLIRYSALLFLFASIQAVSRFGWRHYMFGTSRRVEFDILNSLFARFLKLDKNYFQQQKIGDLMSRATNDIRAVRDFVGLGLLIMVDSLVVIIACVILMAYLHPKLMMVVMIPLPLVSVLFFKFIKEIGKRHEIVQEHLSRITTHVQENLAGIRVLHAFVQEENEKQKFSVMNREYIEKNLRVTRLFAIFTPSLVFTLGISAMISLWIGGKQVILGEMTLGSFVAFNGYLMMLSWPMMGLGYVFNLTQKGLSAVRRIQKILSSRSLVEQLPDTMHEEKISGQIEFRQLSFAYSATDQQVLHSIDLKIAEGETLGIVGRIGSGKTTLAQLLPRLYEVEQDSLFIDGKAIQDYSPETLRQAIGYVDQEPFLFSASLRENISFGCKDASAEEVDRVVQCAGLEADLVRFPQGLETLVGERGVSLSGGQKQRVALARALLKKPEILVLDDAFSSLDLQTERTILKNIRELTQKITTVIITHRLSMVEMADQIIVLENGKIVEKGNHRELLKLQGEYFRMAQNQALAREMEIMLQ